MKPRLYFDLRDILGAPARALSAKQIFVMTASLVVALAVFDLAFYLAHLVSGSNLGVVFDVYGLFPDPSAGLAGPLLILGMFGAVFILMLGQTGVAAVNIEQIRGNRFFSIKDAVRFALSRARTVFLCEIAIAAFVTFIVALFMLLGLFGRIPYLGEWLYSLFVVFPLYFIALFTVFIATIALVSIILTPAIAAADRRGETFGLILETFSTVIRQPLRWLGYTGYALVTGKIASFVYAYFAFRSVQAIVFTTDLTDGGRMRKLVASALSHLPIRSDLFREALTVFPGVDWGISLLPFVRSGDSLASHVMAFMLFLIFASVIGYFLCVVASAQAYGYVVIRYHKDGYRIDEEPPIGEPTPAGTPESAVNSTPNGLPPDPA